MSDRFTLAAQVLLTRRLNNLLRIDETVEIDMDYITCAEYQLFIDAQHAQGKYVQPDHWNTNRFPKGIAKQPIAGVRGSDAMAFCDWLTRQQLTPGFRYRIPTPIEDEEYSTNSSILGCWCGDPQAPIIVCPPELQKQAWLQETEKRSVYNNLDGFDFDRVGTFVREIVSDRDLTFATALSSISARDFIRERARDKSLSLALALALASALASALSNAFDCNDRVHNHEDMDIALTLVHSLVRASASASVSALDLDINLDRAVAHANDLVSVSTLPHISPSIRNRARALARDLDLADALSRTFKSASERTATSDLAYKSSQVYSLCLAENFDLRVSFFNQLGRSGKPIKHLGKNPYFKSVEKYANYRDRAIQIHTFFLLLQLRRQGKIPAWEGIRIVRERIND